MNISQPLQTLFQSLNVLEAQKDLLISILLIVTYIILPGEKGDKLAGITAITAILVIMGVLGKAIGLTAVIVLTIVTIFYNVKGSE